MFRKLVVACVLCWGGALQAAPIAYSSTQFETSAVAIAGALADANFGSSPPLSLPLISSAAVFDATSFASGSGIAAPGLLQTQAEVTTSSGSGSAVGTAEFIGVFDLPLAGNLKFFIDLGDQDFTEAAAFSDATLFVQLVLDGVTYVDRLFTGSDDIFFSVAVPAARRAVVDFLLVSEASVGNGGSAANFAAAQILVVPEPGTIALLLMAALVLAWTRRKLPRSTSFASSSRAATP